VAHLWSLDITPVAATTHETLAADQYLGCISALHLGQALIGAGWPQMPRLHLVTRGAQAPGQGVAVGQAPLWGFGRVMALEHPDLRCRCVDLSPLGPEHEAKALLGELLRDDREDQVALREDGRHVARLTKTRFTAGDATVLEPARGRPFRLMIREPGLLDRLTLHETPRRPPGLGEVEIGVEAAGLNFKDVLSAMGMMPAQLVGSQASGPPLGGECAGTIVAIGEGVAGLREGQEILAFCVAGGALGSFVTTPRGSSSPSRRS
jgi:polyketide synthase 12/epothilone polyketide synthase D